MDIISSVLTQYFGGDIVETASLSETQLYFICEEGLEEGDAVVVMKRGIVTFLVASNKGKTPEHRRFLSLDEITVHSICWKNYTHEKIIRASLRREEATSSTAAQKPTRSSHHLTSKIHASYATPRYAVRSDSWSGPLG